MIACDRKPISSLAEAKEQIEGGKKHAHWHALLAAWLGEAFDAMDASLYFIALVPAISELINNRSDIAVGQAGSLVLAIFMLGWFFGAIGFGVVADRIGRRKTMMLTILIYSIATGFCALAHNWMEFAACRFLVGCGIGGEICLGGVVISEFWSKKGRLWAACALESSFNVGLMLSALANMVLGPHGWRWLFVAGVIPALLTLYIRSNMKESNSFEEVDAVRKSLKTRKKEDLNEEDQSLVRHPILELIQGEDRKRLMLTAVLGSSAVVGYWACVAWIPAWVNQLSGSLAIEERSWATTIFSFGGLVGCFLSPIMVQKLGRANTFKIGFGGGMLATISMFLLVHSYGTPLLIWCALAGALINMQWSGLQVYIPEAFKTSVLATATGICFGAGRIFAAVLALFGGQLIAFYHGSYAYASATLALVYGIGFITAFWLPETNGEVAGTNLNQNRDSRVPELPAILDGSVA